MFKKKGAMEMSIGTIVTIVLAMSMLILGMVLLKNIFSGATDIADLNNEQISGQIAELYGDDDRLVIYPDVDIIEVESGEDTAFAIGIQNLLENVDSSSVTFSYAISFTVEDDCSFTAEDVESWTLGETGDDIQIASGETSEQKILISVPTDTSLCSFKAGVVAYQNGNVYDNDAVYITVTG